MRFFEQYFVEKMKKTQKDDNYFEHFQRKGIIKISKKCVRRKILNRLLEKELNDKQNEDGVRKLANQIIGFVRRAFPERTETSPKTVASSEEIDAKDLDDDDYGTDPNPDDYNVE